MKALNPPPTKTEEFTFHWRNWLSFLYNFLQVESWHEIGGTGEPAFQNSWADAGVNPAFYKDPFDRVWLKGTLGTGTTGTVAFTLPEGYRPSEDYWQVALQPNAVAGTQVNIQTDGDVVLYYTGASITINSISFRV